jgi:Fe2+ or Zn2+ uptake regulation protein
MNSFVMGYPESFIEYFKQFPVTLTSLRKAVLFSLWEAKRPLKAYDILDYLNRIKPTMTAATVYRALDFFMNVGLIHKIESMQAYTLLPIKPMLGFQVLHKFYIFDLFRYFQGTTVVACKAQP